MAILIELHDRTGTRVLSFESGVGIVMDHTRWCGLRIEIEEILTEFKSRATFVDWGNLASRTAYVSEGRQLLRTLRDRFDISFREL